jgi:hypothetical protein
MTNGTPCGHSWWATASAAAAAGLGAFYWTSFDRIVVIVQGLSPACTFLILRAAYSSSLTAPSHLPGCAALATVVCFAALYNCQTWPGDGVVCDRAVVSRSMVVHTCCVLCVRIVADLLYMTVLVRQYTCQLLCSSGRALCEPSLQYVVHRLVFHERVLYGSERLLFLICSVGFAAACALSYRAHCLVIIPCPSPAWCAAPLAYRRVFVFFVTVSRKQARFFYRRCRRLVMSRSEAPVHSMIHKQYWHTGG